MEAKTASLSALTSRLYAATTRGFLPVPCQGIHDLWLATFLPRRTAEGYHRDTSPGIVPKNVSGSRLSLLPLC